MLPTVHYILPPMISYGMTQTRFLANNYDRHPIFSVYSDINNTLQSIQNSYYINGKTTSKKNY